MYVLACSLVFTSQAHNGGGGSGEKRSGNTHRKNVTAIVEPGAADQNRPGNMDIIAHLPQEIKKGRQRA